MSRANLDRLGVLHWLAYVVGNFACAVFPNRFANSVLTSPLFPDGLADRVLTSSLFPDRLADRVANVFAAGFPNRLADGVFTSSLFPNRLANSVANFFGASLGNVARAGDGFIFTHTVVARLVTSMTLLFPLNTSDSLHHNVTAHLTARGATTVTRRATVPRFCLSGNKLQSHAGNEGRIKKASHVSLPPFELRVAA